MDRIIWHYPGTIEPIGYDIMVMYRNIPIIKIGHFPPLLPSLIRKGGFTLKGVGIMRVFISHPYADDPKGNFKKVDKICKELIKQGITPISPLHLFSVYDNDNNRDEITAICRSLINISDEVWLYGNSRGCIEEGKYALSIGKPISYKG